MSETCCCGARVSAQTWTVLSAFRAAHKPCRAAWASAMPVAVPPGQCGHASGAIWPGRDHEMWCELLAGHAGAHEANRGSMSGAIVWMEAEAPSPIPTTPRQRSSDD